MTADQVMGDMFNQYDPSHSLDVKGEDGDDVDQCDEMMNCKWRVCTLLQMMIILQKNLSMIFTTSQTAQIDGNA